VPLSDGPAGSAGSRSGRSIREAGQPPHHLERGGGRRTQDSARGVRPPRGRDDPAPAGCQPAAGVRDGADRVWSRTSPGPTPRSATAPWHQAGPGRRMLPRHVACLMKITRPRRADAAHAVRPDALSCRPLPGAGRRVVDRRTGRPLEEGVRVAAGPAASDRLRHRFARATTI
jgi:hypothetical protein